MENKKIFLSLLAVLLAGCVPSLHRLYTDDTVVFEEKLPGRWVQDDEGNVWTFTKGDDKGYNLIIRDGDKSGKFVVHLVKLEDMLFMDMFPGELESEDMIDFYAIHLIPGHTFMKMRMKMKMDMLGVELSMMNPDKVSDILNDNPELVKHEKVDDSNGLVLTASTRDLQKFMVKYAETEKFFGDAMELKKSKGIFQAKDAIFDSRLVGKWTHKKQTIVSSSVRDKYYRIIITEPEKRAQKYTAVLVEAKGMKFWAMFNGDIEGDLLASPWIAPDMVSLIEQISPKLQLKEMGSEKMTDVFDQGPEAVKKAFSDITLLELEPVK